jgi:uncharacterized protein (DUF2344 family)
MIDRKTIDHKHSLAQFTTEHEKSVKAIEETQRAFEKIMKDPRRGQTQVCTPVLRRAVFCEGDV